MASNVLDSPVQQQTFVEEIDYSEIQELSVNTELFRLLLFHSCLSKHVINVDFALGCRKRRFRSGVERTMAKHVCCCEAHQFRG